MIAMLASHSRVLVQVLAALLSICLLANMSGEAAEDGSSPSSLAVLMGDQDAVPGCWLQPVPALALTVLGAKPVDG